MVGWGTGKAIVSRSRSFSLIWVPISFLVMKRPGPELEALWPEVEVPLAFLLPPNSRLGSFRLSVSTAVKPPLVPTAWMVPAAPSVSPWPPEVDVTSTPWSVLVTSVETDTVNRKTASS